MESLTLEAQVYRVWINVSRIDPPILKSQIEPAYNIVVFSNDVVYRLSKDGEAQRLFLSLDNFREKNQNIVGFYAYYSDLIKISDLFESLSYDAQHHTNEDLLSLIMRFRYLISAAKRDLR